MPAMESFIPEKNETPPRTRLILRVGVTGHRPDKLDEIKLDALNNQLARIFEQLQNIVTDAHKNAAGAYTPEAPLIRIISPLADGADQIVAKKAIENKFELQCPLPFFRPENSNEAEKLYGKNLNDAIVLELDGSGENKEEAYLAAGRMVLRHSDVLIAIWDKNDARGVGGTAQIIQEARKLWIPTIWINSVNPNDAHLFDPSKDEGQDSNGLSGLTELLLKKLIPPVEKKKHDSKDHDDRKKDLRKEYFKESMPQFNIKFLWKFLSQLAHWRIALPPPKKDEPKYSVETGTQLQDIVSKIEIKLHDHYKFADQLASRYSQVYLGGFIWNFMMSGYAVMFAFLAFVLEVSTLGYAELFAIAELIAIASIILIYLGDKKGRWYDRRIDYRLLAELLRQTRFLITIGRIPPLSAPQPIHSHYGDPSASWVYWHYLAIVKQLGLPQTKLTPEYLRAAARLIKSETDEQVSYHDQKSHQNFKINQRLHKWAVRMFILAAIGCSLHVAKHFFSKIEQIQYIGPVLHEYVGPFLEEHEDDVNELLSFFSIVSPAFGAALAGIRSQGEFERVARHYSAMAEYLNEKSKELEDIQHVSNLTSASLARLVDDIAEKRIQEVLDWRIVFHERPIELA